MVPRVGNETLRPLGVAMGNALSVTRVWRYICKNTIRWPATAHDVTTGTTIIKGPSGEYIIHFFVWSLRPKHGPKPRGRSVSFPTRGTMVTYVTWDIPLHGNFELRPLGVAMGNVIPTPPCWGECKPNSSRRRALINSTIWLRELPLWTVDAVSDIIPFGQKPELHTLLTC